MTTGGSGRPSLPPLPERPFEPLRWRPFPRSRWDRAADIGVFVVSCVTVALIFWTMLRLDARSEELNAVLREQRTPCFCATPARP
jgi:hypothetical protein